MSNDTVALARAEWIAQHASTFDAAMAACDSPIERMFLATFMTSTTIDRTDGYDVWGRARTAMRLHGPVRALFTFQQSSMLLVQPTVRLDADTNYRLDFAMFVDESEMFASELDGHDFHERTKKQATRDKARDRRLTAAGWKTLRFSGSEVFADPTAAAFEAYRLASDAEDRALARATVPS